MRNEAIESLKSPRNNAAIVCAVIDRKSLCRPSIDGKQKGLLKSPIRSGSDDAAMKKKKELFGQSQSFNFEAEHVCFTLLNKYLHRAKAFMISSFIENDLRKIGRAIETMSLLTLLFSLSSELKTGVETPCL